MDNWNYIKEERKDDEYYNIKPRYQTTLDSYFTFTSKQLNQKFKTESVELETLTEDTLTQSSSNDRYALPWDFVKIPHTQNQNNLTKITAKTLKDDKTTTKPESNLTQQVVKKKRLVVSPIKSKKKVKERAKSSICNVCGITFDQLSKYKQHLSVHKARKEWECDTCKKKFKLKQYLNEHLQSDCTNTYKCNDCPKSYENKSTLRHHIIQMHNKKNDLTNKPNVKSNLEKENSEEARNNDSETSIKLYKCDICGETFEKKSSMRVHIEFLHIEIFGDNPIVKAKPKPKVSSKPFKCHICHRRYTQSSHLHRHKKTHSPRKLHICELCDQSFTTWSSLRRHMLNKHENNFTQKMTKPSKKIKNGKKFACKICDKSFTQHFDLRRHCATHDARKPYECDICKKQFGLKPYLYAHVLTHNNWKTYPCDSCSKIYRRKSSLQRHIDINHSGKKKYECKVCFKSYKNPESHRLHMKTFHQDSSSDD